MPKTIYLSGPMSGLPDYNYPAFHAAAAHLRGLGYVVESPAELPEPPCKSWAGYMRLALAQLVRCDITVRLPGWYNSRGAVIESSLARMLGMDVQDYASFVAHGEAV
jgi:hypothetical protein